MRDKRKQASDASEQPLAKRQKDAGQKKKKEYEVQNLAEQNEGTEMKAKGVKGVQSEMKEPVQEKTKVYADQCTAFVSNLNLKASIHHQHPSLFSCMHYTCMIFISVTLFLLVNV